MSTMYGADVAELRTLATAFDRAADGLEAMTVLVTDSITISAWAGPFAVSFRFRWSSDYRLKLAGASGILRRNSRSLRQNADAQERASAADAPMRACTETGEVFGYLDPSVAAEWKRMTNAEREQVLRRLAQRLADRYGIETPQIAFRDLDDSNGNAFGYYNSDSDLLVIDTTDLDNPLYAINTLSHEMRHAGQHEMVRDAQLDQGEVRRGYRSDVWTHTEVSPETARKWAENFKDYQRPEDDFDKYWQQPVEVDARNAGREGVNSMTPELLRELREENQYG